MLVLAATLIVGNIIADMLLAAARSARAPRREGRHDRDPRRGRVRCRRQGRPERRRAGVRDLVAKGRLAQGGESYRALVWRRFRRSLSGMIGLVLVSLLLIMAVFADFFAPVEPKEPNLAFSPPDAVSFFTADGSFTLRPRVYPIVETDELDPVTFQPLTGPDYENPIDLGFFVQGRTLQDPLADPGRHPLLRRGRRPPGAFSRHRQARPRHPLARHRRLAHLADHRADRGDHHHDRRHHRRHHLRLSRRPVRRLAPAVRRRGARLPAAAALPRADHAHPDHGAVERVHRLRHRRARGARLGAALARGARQDAGAGAHRVCARGDGGRRRRRAHHLPPHPAERAQPRHRRGHARDPGGRAARIASSASSASP